MAINELLTNRCKHAFSRMAQGSICLTITRETSGHIRIDYSDNGSGFDAIRGETSHSGALGLSLVKTIAEHQLGGSLDFEQKNGMRCTILFRDNAYRERVTQ